ncbi:hypothetical protein KUTeg_012429, partial [Tegillarca granosa]
MGPLRVMIAWLMTIILLCDIIMAAPADNYGDSSDKLSRLHEMYSRTPIRINLRHLPAVFLCEWIAKLLSNSNKHLIKQNHDRFVVKRFILDMFDIMKVNGNGIIITTSTSHISNFQIFSFRP